MTTAAGKVEFDFVGSLELARQLWQLAAEVERVNGARQKAYETAKTKWLGAYGDEFVTRRDAETSSSSNIVVGLQDGAKSWAQAWAKAMDQQNKNNRAAKVKEISDRRSNAERFTDFAIVRRDDSDDQVPKVPQVAVPVPPLFLATATVTK